MLKGFVGFDLVHQMYTSKHNKRFDPSKGLKKGLKFLFIFAVFFTLWFLPSDVFGMDGLTQVQQRIIAIFAYATMMWVMELIPSWATSVSIMGLLLLFTSDSGVKWICNPDVVGNVLSYKQIMASFADPVIMLFIGGFVLAIATTKSGLDVHLAKVLLTPSGLYAGYGLVLDVHQQHRHNGHDADVFGSCIQATSGGRQGTNSYGAQYSCSG